MTPRPSLRALALAGFITAIDMRVIDPLLPVVAREFQIGIGTAGLMVTGFALPYGVFQLLYGPWADRVGKITVMAWALAVFAAAHLGFLWAHDFATVVALRFLNGAASAAIISLSLAHIGDTFPYEERQAAIGGYMTATIMGHLLGGSVGGIASEWLGWREMFVVLGAIAGAATVALFRQRRLAKPTAVTAIPAWRRYARLLRDRPARLVLITVFIEGTLCFGSFAFFGAMLRDRYALTFTVIGLLLGGYGLGGLIYSRSVRWLLRRYDELGLMRRGLALVVGGLLTVALVPFWPLFALANIALGGGFYMLHSTLQTKATELAPTARGSAVALFAFSLFLGQAVGTAVLGPTVERLGYAPTLAGSALIFLAAMLPIIRGFSRLRA